MKNQKSQHKEMLSSYRSDGKEAKLYTYILHIVGISIVYVLFGAFFTTGQVSAQEQQLSLTIAPPIFQLNLQPGETWSSGITVVNNNRYNATLYAETVLFEPSGESGRPVFIDVPLEDMEGVRESSLAGWITIPQGGFFIEREQTYTLPIVIKVPEDAQPGGHYAAILIGNKAPEGSAEGGTVNVTSSVASLIFLSVAGEVDERGRIRDFSTQKSIYEKPQAQLSLRFENQGNVHLLPQGNIVIYNMFGVERGVIPINHNSGYGTVLPGSIRKFSFDWKSETGIWDIGRYRAEATINYGKAQKQVALATTYFYVLPIMPLFYVLAVILGLVLFFMWAVRAYIRKALSIETVHRNTKVPTPTEEAVQVVQKKEAIVHTSHTAEKPKTVTLGTLLKPIQTGFVDLRNIGTKNEITLEKKEDDSYKRAFEERLQIEQQREHKNSMTVRGFFDAYKGFFVFILVLAVTAFAVNVFFDDVLTVEREYDVTEIKTN